MSSPALDIGEGERGIRERETRAGERSCRAKSRVRVDKVKKVWDLKGVGREEGSFVVCKWAVESFRG